MAAPSFDSQDVAQNKVLGGLGHLVFFLPLLACPSSAFGKHAANQGLIGMILLLACAFMSWVIGWLPIVGWIIRFALWLVQVVVSLLMIYYTYKAVAQGDSQEFPVVGGIQLIK